MSLETTIADLERLNLALRSFTPTVSQSPAERLIDDLKNDTIRDHTGQMVPAGETDTRFDLDFLAKQLREMRMPSLFTFILCRRIHDHLHHQEQFISDPRSLVELLNDLNVNRCGWL